MTSAGVPVALSGWRALIDALGEPAWLVGALDQRVLAVNAEALALLGQAEAAVLGQLADSLIATPEDMAFWDEVRTGNASLLESDTVLVDGAGRLVQVRRRICP
ncbi:MAG: hypothetical protein CFE45_38760, partial [Burkholderiales bacterium PBB5]